MKFKVLGTDLPFDLYPVGAQREDPLVKVVGEEEAKDMQIRIALTKIEKARIKRKKREEKLKGGF